MIAFCYCFAFIFIKLLINFISVMPSVGTLSPKAQLHGASLCSMIWPAHEHTWIRTTKRAIKRSFKCVLLPATVRDVRRVFCLCHIFMFLRQRLLSHCVWCVWCVCQYFGESLFCAWFHRSSYWWWLSVCGAIPSPKGGIKCWRNIIYLKFSSFSISSGFLMFFFIFLYLLMVPICLPTVFHTFFFSS